MRMKCKYCGSENVTVLMFNHYTYGPLKGKVFQAGLRCWDCGAGEPLLDKDWADYNTYIGKVEK